MPRFSWYRVSRKRPSNPSRATLTALIAVVLAAAPPPPAAAQIGFGTDILTGRITTAGGTPLRGVTIEAYSLETQVTRRAQTDQNGRYTILFTDGGGQYRMTARIIGFQPVQEIIMRQSDEDRLIWNPQLTPGAMTLEPIVIEGRQRPLPVRTPQRPTPGSTEQVLNPDLVNRLPIDPEDLNLLATLVPGVIAIDATDSTAAAFSVAGLGPEANALTLDGLLFGSGSIPQDALRQTRVVTSTYDVSRGRFSGGLVAATTRSGSNVLQGSSGYTLRDDDLAFSTDSASPYTQGFTQNVISGGLGGPIVRDRLFVFGSGQARLRSDPQQTLLTATAGDFDRLGVHPDSVARFLDILDSLGIPRGAPVNGGRSNDNLSAMVRLDFLASNAHTVTLRGDWRGRSTEPARLGPLSMPETGGTASSGGGGGLLSVTSRFGMRLINDGRVSIERDHNDGDPFLVMPQGRVQVASSLRDTATAVTSLVFGGSSGLPTRASSTSIQGTDEVSWLAGHGHRVRFGGLFSTQRRWSTPAGNLNGTYTYQSLAALETDSAAMFRRTLGVVERATNQLDWALFAADVWQASPRFQMTYGLRLEGGRFAGAPEYNPTVDSAFGRRTDALPSEWHLSPRTGFTLSIGGETGRGRLTTPPAVILRGGIGEFRSPLPAGLVNRAYGATGLDAAGQEIVCTGLGVPDADWSGLATGTAAVPDACLSAGPIPPRAVRPVTVFSPGFTASRAWRASLGAQRTLSTLFRLNIDASYARGVSQAGARDLNLDTVPKFLLGAEADRPVYVDPGTIVPSTGALRFTDSRIYPRFGQVAEMRSDLASESWQATISVGGILGRGIQLRTAYTYQRARDQGATGRGAGFGGGGGATTAGNPNVLEWGRSDLERRHQFLLTLTYPFGTSLEVTSIGRLTSGTPFTPIVGADINGDGARNDRAYLFPAGSDPAGDAIARLITAGTGSVKSCLTNYLGQVAERNMCTGPWQASLDFQLNWRPAFLGLNRRLSIQVVTVNFLRVVDELLHGADGAKGWGLRTRPDPTLLYVTGFDSQQQRFVYQVNDRFGATAGAANAFRPPFQIGLQARFTLGPDRRRQALDRLRGGGGRGGFGGGFGRPGGPGPRGGGPEGLLARLETVLPNPAALVLDQRDSSHLELTSEQIARLEAVRDSLSARSTARADTLAKAVQEAGDTPEPRQLLATVRPVLQRARTDVVAVHATVKSILTAEQWARLPERIRNLPETMLRVSRPNRPPPPL